MNLIDLIQAYDGCKRLMLVKASKNLEKTINSLTLKIKKEVTGAKTKEAVEVEAQ